jgi:hypothetical protein
MTDNFPQTPPIIMTEEDVEQAEEEALDRLHDHLHGRETRKKANRWSRAVEANLLRTPVYPAGAMADDQHPHLVNISEVKKMTVGELFQQMADHEKQYIDQLKPDARKREEECNGSHFFAPPEFSFF